MTSYPPPPPTGQPGGPPPQYGPPVPPPAAPDTSRAVSVPVVAWLVPVAALLAVVGAVTPWFKAKATASAAGQSIHHTFDGLYSFKDGKIGLLAPVLLVIIAIGVVGLLIGRSPARFGRNSANPVASAGKAAIVAGALSLVCVIIAWFLVKTQYKFKDNGKSYSWDDYIKLAKDSGVKLELSRGPQIGYFLTIAAGLVAIIAGVLMVLAARTGAAGGEPTGYQQGGYQQAAYQPGGYQQGGYQQGGQQGGYQQGGYQQDGQQGGHQQGGYPQGGYPQGGYQPGPATPGAPPASPYPPPAAPQMPPPPPQ